MRIASVVRELMNAGLDGADLLAALERIDADQESDGRSTAAKRQARYRERNKSVTKRNIVTDGESVTNHNESVTKRNGVTPSRVENNLLLKEKSGKKENKNLVVDLDFEAAWRAYPHRKGRSSKPKSVIAWRAIEPHQREAVLSAIKRYAFEGHEPKADCGAKAFELWLKDQRYLDWMEDSFKAPPLTAQQQADWERLNEGETGSGLRPLDAFGAVAGSG